VVHDTVKLRLLVYLCEECELNDILLYGDPAIELADKLLKDQSDLNLNSTQLKIIINAKAVVLTNLAFLYSYRGNISVALDYYDKSLKIMEEIGDKKNVASVFNNIGLIYSKQGDKLKAVDYLTKSMKIYEELGNKNGIVTELNNIALIYKNQNDGTMALIYLEKALKINREIRDKKEIGISHNNIGLIYLNQGDYNKAIDYFGRSLSFYEEIGFKRGIAGALHNMALVCKKQSKIPEALSYFGRSLKLYKIDQDRFSITVSYRNIGGVYLEQKKYFLAISYLDSSLKLSKALGFPENIRDAEIIISKIDSAMGNYSGAFEHYKQFIIFRDSLNNESTRKASIKSQLKYEYEKKEAVIKEQQEKERVVSEEKNRRQQIVIWSVAAGLLLVIGFAAFVFRSLKVTRRQKIIIEEKQKDILDSIRYAKRIQQSLLPSGKYITKNLARLLKN